MEIVSYPDKAQWGELLRRPHIDNSSLMQTVQGVIDDVRQRGDAAVR